MEAPGRAGVARRHVGINARLIVSLLVVGLTPLVLVGAVSAYRAYVTLAAEAGNRMQVAAVEAGEKIDRNLFERYGDVQAFAANPLARGTDEEATEVLNTFTDIYGIYDLMLIVELDGTIKAVNTVDGSGAPIDSAGLVGRSVASEEWFQVVSSGETPPGGTYYTDVERSEVVAEVYGDQRLTLPFSAPIHDETGQMVAVWHNAASFQRVVSDIMGATRAELRARGIESVESQVLRRDGVVIDDSLGSGVLSFNPVDAGQEAARLATGGDGGEGYTREVGVRLVS